MIKTLYPCFQHWSEKGSIYIISDTHFYDLDRDIMGYDFSEMDQFQALLKLCHKNDTLIHLGDVGEPYLLDSIKSHKVLIMGNHDAGRIKKHFNEVYEGPLWVAEKLALSHEPLCLELSATKTPIAFNIHGHDHSRESINDYHLNICQNIYGYYPLNLKQFINSGRLKQIPSIHRATIDRQIERKKERENFMKKYFPF